MQNQDSITQYKHICFAAKELANLLRKRGGQPDLLEQIDTYITELEHVLREANDNV